VQETPARTAEQVQADVQALRTTWQELANAGDFNGVAALYTQDATYVDPFGGIHEGPAAIAAYLAQPAGVSTTTDIQITGTVSAGDMGASWGTFSQTLTDATGTTTTMSGMWQTVGLYQPDGSMKIRLHHTMIPAPRPAAPPTT
jgi:ketosteroid isomerase-like protein